MDQVLQFLQNTWAQIQPTWENLVFVVADLTGLQEFYAKYLIVGIVAYIVLVYILVKIHHGMSSRQRKRVAKVVKEYDRIWYLTAKAMYSFNERMNAEGKVNQLAHGTRSVLKLDDKDYLHNRKKIMDDVAKLEVYIGQQYIPDDLKKRIRNLHLAITGANVTHKLVGWTLTAMTFGLYLMGWKRVYYR